MDSTGFASKLDAKDVFGGRIVVCYGEGMDLPRWIVGRPLASREQQRTKIGVLAGVPAMGLDGLTSSAYGPEAALAILLPLGMAGPRYILPIMGVILVLLVLLYLSYRQTLGAYPSGGGSYTVARENLGVWTGLLAAAALMIDYVLNVAVGISAGVAALVSAVPGLHGYTLVLCLGVLVVITLMNLRGTGEAGVAFAVPTYAFLASLGAVLGWGVYQTLASDGHPVAVEAPTVLPVATQMVGPWLLLRSFASGCTAMTGVETVSNGVNAFRDPPAKNARLTLTIIVVALGLLLGAIAFLARAYGIGATEQDKPGYQSVLSQLVGAIVGRGWIYYVTLGALLATLCLSANTSFVGFPRLCRVIAKDDFLPRGFAVSGRRLVYTVGVLFLAGAAGTLLTVFEGITDRLIPLFAVGAFLAFTLSQAGMVMHWYRQRGEADRPARLGRRSLHLLINAVGAVATGVALVIIVSAKFLEGAWITVLAIPLLLSVFRLIHRYYQRLEGEVAAHGPLDLGHNQPPVVLVPIQGWDKLTGKVLRFAMWLSTEVVAVHLSNLSGEEDSPEAERIHAEWRAMVEDPAHQHGVPAPALRLVQAPYRKLVPPMLGEIDRLKRVFPGRQIAVVIPEVADVSWRRLLLHRHKAEALRRALRRRGDSQVIVIDVPWYVRE